MGEKITSEIVGYISNLAKLRLSSEEMQQMQKDMQQILDYAEVLNRIDTDGVEPMTQPLTYGNVFRCDEAVSDSSGEEILSCIPNRDDGQYLVPFTLEHGGNQDV